jgi:hypothetical protein
LGIVLLPLSDQKNRKMNGYQDGKECVGIKRSVLQADGEDNPMKARRVCSELRKSERIVNEKIADSDE